MKARDVSVSVSDFGDGLHVIVTMKLPGRSLGREVACPEPSKGDATKFGTRVAESSRRAAAKEIRKILESVELPDA